MERLTQDTKSEAFQTHLRVRWGGEQKWSACGVLDVGASYVDMLSLQKLIKLYTCDLYTFLCVCYTSIIFFKLKK